MKVSEELKKRIRQLEEEQERQHQELKDLDELRDLATMKELEKELSEINDQMAKSSDNLLLDDIDLSLEEILQDLERETFEGQSEAALRDIDLSLESPLSGTEEKEVLTEGYTVCLMFNPNAPSEWSDDAGGGWRGRNMGARYASYASAEERLKALKKKWPDNPMQVLRLRK